jgi:hypothetical protein
MVSQADRRMRGFIRRGLVLLGVCVLAACGGSGSNSSGTTGPSTGLNPYSGTWSSLSVFGNKLGTVQVDADGNLTASFTQSDGTVLPATGNISSLGAVSFGWGGYRCTGTCAKTSLCGGSCNPGSIGASDWYLAR